MEFTTLDFDISLLFQPLFLQQFSKHQPNALSMSYLLLNSSFLHPMLSFHWLSHYLPSSFLIFWLPNQQDLPYESVLLLSWLPHLSLSSLLPTRVL